MIGRKISHYKILKKIGEGGMGEVFLARDSQLNRDVAIKFLPPKQSFDKTTQLRFQQEARTAASLNHPNIITIFELAEFQSHFYIVMEYVKGSSLRHFIQKKKLKLNQILDIAIQFTEGIGFAHQSGVIHRDIKPENIIVSTGNHIKIVDFGLAKLSGASRLTREKTTLGTFQYMSPEQAMGKETDSRSDLFSFGTVLYEMLTGLCPFAGEYEASIIYAIINETPPPLSQYRQDLPASLTQIVARALHKNPEQRFQNAGELNRALKTVKESMKTGAQAPPVSLPPAAEAKESAVRPQPEPPFTIDDLLEARQRIDQQIAQKFTREVTIMFCDVVGSTDYFSRRGDLEGRAMLKRYTKLMFPVIGKNDGTVIKTIGDGILASFLSAPLAGKCAVEMQSALAQDNKNYYDEDRIAIRIALHCGQAVVDQNDVYGDVVNVASRVEKCAGGEEILVSHAFYLEARSDDSQHFLPAGETLFKGKSVKIKLYRLLWKPEEIAAFLRGDLSRAGAKASAAPIASSSQTASGEIISKSYVEIREPFKLEPAAPSEEKGRTETQANPYMNRVKISHIDEFFGRQAEIRKIFARVGASRPQSISIVGERRIGKSSLLNYVAHPQNRLKYLQGPHQYLFVPIDFQEKKQLNIPGFFQMLYAGVQEEFGDKLEMNILPDYTGFKKLVTTLDHQGLKLILLFDEFEVITRNTEFGADFYSFLRSMANNFNVAYVVSSGRNLQKMCHSREISDSPFFNIFSNLTLSQFSEAEARALITEPARKLNIDLTPHIEDILDMAGYYPFFLQMACAAVFEQVKDGAVNLAARIQEDFFDEAKVHFQQIWDVCDKDRRQILMQLAAGYTIERPMQFIVRELVKQGYVKIENDRQKIFSRPFGEFILNNFGAEMGIRRRRKFLFWNF